MPETGLDGKGGFSSKMKFGGSLFEKLPFSFIFSLFSFHFSLAKQPFKDAFSNGEWLKPLPS